MKSIVIKLKQHTPLIHFQSEQEGATLRASEVKPKLDKYIVSKSGGETEMRNSPIMGNWFINKEHPALNYKMRIEIGEKEVSTNKLPMYFGDKKAVIDKKQLTQITIFCLSAGLEVKIKELIVAFFNDTTFGARQSKGYGSFTVVEINEETKPSHYYSFFDIYTNRRKDVLMGIDKLWKFMRCNATRSYLSMKTERNKHWEKDLIKNFKNIHFHPNKAEIDMYRDIKDHLGLSTIECWNSLGFDIRKQASNNEIQRMQSPVLFKPVRLKDYYRVYIILNGDLHIKPDTTLTIWGEKKGQKMTEEIKNVKFLQNFDLQDFMDFVIKLQNTPEDKDIKKYITELSINRRKQ
jgi:hypothetical protein